MRLSRVCRNAAIVSLVGLSAGIARAQDFYDTSVLRTVNIQFHDANWLALLKANYAAQVNILADLTIDNVTYPSVGVRIRGNTSYTALPAGSEKFSINIDTDAVDPNQEITGGYSSLNFNNGFHDPTFCREVLYNNYVASFMPNMRANHVIVTLNGQNWGVYNNIQQFNKKMLSTHFPDTSGLRIKCANNPAGPGLRYNGATASGYTGYEIKDDGGLADPWAAHIAVCNALTNASTANWQTTIDPIFAVDPSIWSVVFENILTDDDSYVNKGADFMTYRNPTDRRTYLLQTDANETFTQTTWSPTLNFTQTTKPFLSRVLAVPELRQRYSHYRTAKADLNWAFFGPTATELRTQIDAAVNADPKKLYSYTLFNNNFTASVTLPYSGPAGGTVPGIQPFLTSRTNSLNAIAEMAATGPVISSVTPSNATPDPIETVTISAAVAPSASGAISKVELWYRPSPSGTYQRTLMSVGSPGIYSAVLPVVASPGQKVDYYVAATTANTYGSMSFSPTHTEWTPLSINYSFAASGGMRITEFMYSGVNGEFVEFTNMSGAAIDLTGWSFDDDHAVAGAFSLSALGTVQPGESVIITEAVAETFRTAWGLGAGVKILGGLGVGGIGNNLARNDQVNLYNASNTLVDRLRFGDQTYTGTIRTQNASGQPCSEYVGEDSIANWHLSAVGDAHGSFASSGNDKGTPGLYIPVRCTPCPGDFNNDGMVDDADFIVFAAAYDILDCADPGMPATCPADLNDDGFADDADFVLFAAAYNQLLCP